MTENEQTDENSLSRRSVMAKTLVAGATVTSPSWVTVATAETDSGNVELETDTTIPTDTSIDVTVHESSNGSTSTQTESLSGGATETTMFASLDGEENAGYSYYLEFDLATTDDAVTPEIDSATITLPAPDQTPTSPTPTEEPPGEPVEPPDEPQGLGELWNNYQAFVAGVVLAFAAIGLWSKSLTLAAFVSYMAFVYIAITTGTPLFENIAYVTLVLTFIGFAFKLWRLEMGGE